MMSLTYHLQLVLPKLLLLGLVEEREVADMVDEYEAQQGELRVLGRNLASVGAKGRAEALQGGGGGEFCDFILCLPRDELTLEICGVSVEVRGGGTRAVADSALACPSGWSPLGAPTSWTFVCRRCRYGPGGDRGGQDGQQREASDPLRRHSGIRAVGGRKSRPGEGLEV
jgi:hypothetical protein